jgi:hypothetical protein
MGTPHQQIDLVVLPYQPRHHGRAPVFWGCLELSTWGFGPICPQETLPAKCIYNDIVVITTASTVKCTRSNRWSDFDRRIRLAIG